MVKKIQASFTGGELDPRLWARVDISKYATGARLLSNFLIHPYGGASNRPGLEFISLTRGGGGGITRLAPFDAGNGDSYVLQFTDGEIFFYRGGAPIIWTHGEFQGLPYGVPSPYTGSQVFELKIQQSNDVLTITHPDHPPRTLSRYDNDDWRFEALSFAETIPPPIDIVIAPQTRPIQSGEYQWPVDETYVLTNVDAETGRESLPSAPFFQLIDLSLRGFYTILEWRRNSESVLRSNVYKKRGGVYGKVGEGSINRYENGVAIFRFEDRNISPDMTQGIQIGQLPFQVPSDYPECSTYYQQRRVFAGMKGKPNRVRASQSSDYNNFNTSFPSRDSDALDFSIAQERRQDIKHMVSLEDLILFTTSGEWRVRGSQEGLLAPSTIDARLQSQYGCLPNVPPVQISDDIVFVQAKGQTIRSIRYEFSSNKYTGEPLNLLAAHLFEGRQVKQMAYAAVPFSILYCVMTDGAALAFTYLRDQEVFAWSRVETQGFFESVTVVQEGLEDVAYFVVNRGFGTVTRRCIERLGTRRIEDVKDSFFVDCALRLNDPHGVFNIGPGDNGNLVVECELFGAVTGDLIDLSGVRAAPVYDIDGNVDYFGMYSTNGEGDINRRFKIGFVSADTERARLTLAWPDTGTPVQASEFGAYVGGGAVRKVASVVTGAGHLNGLFVSGTIDGIPVGGLQVVNGSVALPFPGSRVAIGMEYTSTIETLDLELGPQANGEPKNISNIIIKVDKTRGLIYAHGDDGVKYEMDPRGEPGGDAYADGGLWTGQFTARNTGEWNHTGRMWLRAKFLPCTILAIIPDVEAGGAADERQG